MAIETVTREEAQRILGCSRSKVFELLRAGVLEAAPRFGRSLVIFRASVDAALLGEATGGQRRRRRARVTGVERSSLDEIPVQR